MRTAVVLAAGSGKKLWPYGSTWAKTALPLANRPILDRLLANLKAVGIEQTVVVAGHLAAQVSHVAAGRAGVAVVTAPPDTGTAGALSAALPLISEDEWLVVYGDTLPSAADLKALVDRHRDSGRPATVLATPLEPGERALDWICVRLENGLVADLMGHPRRPLYEHRLAGAFAMDRRFVPYLQRNPGFMQRVPTGGMPPMEADLAGSLGLLLDDGIPLPALATRVPCPDVDKPWQLLQWNRWQAMQDCEALTASVIHPTARIHDSAEIAGHVMLGEGASIGPGAVIKGNLIAGPGTMITHGALVGANTVMGANCRVTEYARIEEASVLGDRVRVGHCAEVDGLLMEQTAAIHCGEFAGICGRKADLGAGTLVGTLRFDDGVTPHRVQGRSEFPLHFANCAYLGDFTRTGVGAILLPGAKVGAYACVGPGVVVRDEVPERTLLLLEQSLVTKQWGPEKYGW
jgi:UDP-N-acetylglucosamine diphosphorylase / glucose-1-phosphate thymidylyltransferase / UDP-N-acetylgalactosamine diphosphorylase / glucosamine-1-phosphate N-acetyltransferase / galactosamine-1-phosphate N-acetyltransferase